jgi:hypothetical protein
MFFQPFRQRFISHVCPLQFGLQMSGRAFGPFPFRLGKRRFDALLFERKASYTILLS